MCIYIYAHTHTHTVKWGFYRPMMFYEFLILLGSCAQYVGAFTLNKLWFFVGRALIGVGRGNEMIVGLYCF